MDVVLGLSMKDSVLAEVEGQAAVFIAEPGTAVAKNDWIAVAKLNDSGRFQAAMTGLITRLMMGKPPVEKEVQGLKMYEMTGRSKKFHLSIIGKIAVFSGSERALVWYSRWLKEKARVPMREQPVKDRIPRLWLE